VNVRAFNPAYTIDVEGDEGDRPPAEEEHLDVEVDPGEHRTDGDRTAEPAETRLRDLCLIDEALPSSSPEEAVASSLLALRHSTPTIPLAEAAVDDGGDGLFVSEGSPIAPRHTEPMSSEQAAIAK
jgi:hypothetical protein